jgi:hypothetical protein
LVSLTTMRPGCHDRYTDRTRRPAAPFTAAGIGLDVGQRAGTGGATVCAVQAEIAVLGELRITVHGIDVTPTAPRERAMLAVLAVHRGRAVATDRLAEELWPGLPGDRARHVVRVRVADLRQRFGRVGAAALLESSPSGYLLHLERVATDVERFETLLHSGRGLSEVGDPAGEARPMPTSRGR